MTLKKGFESTKTPTGSKPACQNFAQVMKTEFFKLQKSIKKEKTCRNKKKCDYDINSFDNS